MIRENLTRRIEIKRNRQNQQESQSMTPNIARFVRKAAQRALDTIHLRFRKPVPLQDMRINPPRCRQLIVRNQCSLPSGLNRTLYAVRQLILRVLHMLITLFRAAKFAINRRLSAGLKIQQQSLKEMNSLRHLPRQRRMRLPCVLVLLFEDIDKQSSPALSLPDNSIRRSSTLIAHGLQRRPCPLDTLIQLQIAVFFELVKAALELGDESIDLLNYDAVTLAHPNLNTRNKV